MIGEVLLAIKALDSAFVVVQSAIAKKKEVEDMAGEVGRFFTAKKKVEEEMAKAEAAGTEDLLVGSALEEAITLDQQRERMEKMMEKIRDHYMRQGKTHRWGKIKAEAAKIEKKREVKRKQKAAAEKAEDALVRDLAVMFAWLVGAVIVIFGIVFLIFGIDAE
jgi:RNA polymerase-interacting CarD/CdnL/TRCF family regulator